MGLLPPKARHTGQFTALNLSGGRGALQYPDAFRHPTKLRRTGWAGTATPRSSATSPAGAARKLIYSGMSVVNAAAVIKVGKSVLYEALRAGAAAG
jgi:hypothetical protein